jgi:pyruvate/2-oxoacid:ferredoxin oxidoreductase alpha subunit/NAD-dependent dihydropyrimidine dehydrogenase PreA subunit
MANVAVRPKPVLRSLYCKGCGRCIDACAHHCIQAGHEIEPATGLVPVVFDPAQCNGCQLCVDACPEPYGFVTEETADGMERARHIRRPRAVPAADVPPAQLPLPESRPLVVKGTYASAIGALLAGCRHVFGYPITPSTEGAELMAKLLPNLGGAFLQAPSEVAAVNMMYGTGGAGLPVMTFTSSPGFSLMLEGISYMVGAEIPAVFMNVMRGGPGLGNIAPEQSDVKLACHGLGHGNTRAIVLAPSTPQEMLDFTILAFELAFRYRNPVVLLADGYLGQMTGKVRLPPSMTKPGLPGWAVSGGAAHRQNFISSIYMAEADLERHNVHLNAKYARMVAAEQRADVYRCDDADVLLVATNTPARKAKGAVATLRKDGIRAGLFRPQTLWPFPVQALLPLLDHVKRIVVVEASAGQLEDELRLALHHAGAGQGIRIDHVQRYGGVLPGGAEIVDAVRGRGPVRSAGLVPADRKEVQP